MIVIGCDPGVTGGLALFQAGVLIDVKDIPNDTIVTEAKGAALRDIIGGPKATKQTRVNPPALAGILREWRGCGSAVLIRENVSVRGGQGAVSNAALMEVGGIIDGVCAALGIEVKKERPSVWKLAMGLNDDKKVSIREAIKLFPRWAESFKRVSIDHDRAEAALIGLYGVRNLQRQ